MLRVWHERRANLRMNRASPQFQLARIMRKPVIVPETKQLLSMLVEFREGRSHMALVVDEFGTVSGLLTVEDAIEQIVGEIEDEYDDRPARPEPDSLEHEVEGSTSILDLEAQYGIELPADAGFQTVAGYMLFRLGHIPESGETVEFEGHRLTVLEMERNRIARVRIDKAPAAGAASEKREAEIAGS
jgi:putative hemolysin